jgi:hypothetical protein
MTRRRLILFGSRRQRLASELSGLVANPLERAGCDQAYNQQIVTAETHGILPIVPVFVRPLEGYVEYGTLVRFLTPDAGAH